MQTGRKPAGQRPGFLKLFGHDISVAAHDPYRASANAALEVSEVTRGCVEFAGEGLMGGKRGANLLVDLPALADPFDLKTFGAQ
jgi:hypothetical protein